MNVIQCLPTLLSLVSAAPATWLQGILCWQDLSSRFPNQINDKDVGWITSFDGEPIDSVQFGKAFFVKGSYITAPWFSYSIYLFVAFQDIDSENAEEDEFYDQEPLPVLGRCKAIYTFEGQLGFMALFRNQPHFPASSEGSIPLEENEELWLIETDQGDGWTRSHFKAHHFLYVLNIQGPTTPSFTPWPNARRLRSYILYRGKQSHHTILL